MKKLRASITIRCSESLRKRVEALAAHHALSVNELLVIWLESQADEKHAELLGKAHS